MCVHVRNLVLRRCGRRSTRTCRDVTGAAKQFSAFVGIGAQPRSAVAEWTGVDPPSCRANCSCVRSPPPRTPHCTRSCCHTRHKHGESAAGPLATSCAHRSTDAGPIPGASKRDAARVRASYSQLESQPTVAHGEDAKLCRRGAAAAAKERWPQKHSISRPFPRGFAVVS